jgi:tRNA dimethylallyltransferase
MIKTIIIVGPTASGKSRFSIELSKYFNNIEIINADAFQIYRQLNIGVNKTNYKKYPDIKHHLFDIKNVNEYYDVKYYKDDCYKIIDEINSKKNIPVICGGTGLFIDAIIKNYDFIEQEIIVNNYEDLSNEELHKKLLSLDPDEANKVHPNNRKRILRSISIYEQTGVKKSSLNKTKKPFIKPLVIYLEPNRERLIKLIENRFDKMIEMGWKQEIEEILKTYPDFFSFNSSKALGYYELFNFSPNEAKDIILKKTKSYAKRQNTWFKNHNYDKIINITFDEYNNDILDSSLVQKIKEFLYET